MFDNSPSSKDSSFTQKPLVFEKLWTVTDVAEYLRVSEKTVYDWVHKRQIPFRKVRRLLRFKPSQIERWLLERSNHDGN